MVMAMLNLCGHSIAQLSGSKSEPWSCCFPDKSPGLRFACLVLFTPRTDGASSPRLSSCAKLHFFPHTSEEASGNLRPFNCMPIYLYVYLLLFIFLGEK